ncbi:hypothetical protein GCM10009069_22790 [Algimonas arctica]|uniref:AB hydrolase-1 domain-containing protein n=1 Tax=Algimonas arctica TaxID=1479486 RepID=A0A8J3G2T3_9PROT|nr:alpha/beta fold hydrolase [Algimonas arctica]GHA99449.1 hypothetical protein GCM10009069_22790 [Algimonas arctica]
MTAGKMNVLQKSWTLFVIGWALILIGLLTAHFVQTSSGVSITPVQYEREDGKMMRALLYTPEEATPASKAPGILAMHGYINSREFQSGFAIEFARRGYVILTPDQSGHGYSDPPAFANGFGGPASLAYLRGLDIVDTDNIGLEGHSMGGWAVLAAAATYPDHYKSLVLEGSSTGAPFALKGTPDWPRNLGLVFSKFDEFSPLMWGTARASDAGAGDKMKAVFNTDETIIEGKVYGDIELGTARALYQPAVTHPGDHISTAAIGHAVDWFAQTLDRGTSLSSRNQIWVLKEVGTLIALIGFVVLLLGSFELLLALPQFSRLRARPTDFAYSKRDLKWWAVAVVSAIIPVATFYPFFKLSEAVLPASALLPQSVTTQVAVWAVLNAIILTLIGLLVRGAPVKTETKVGRALIIALLTVGIGYFATWLASAVFHLDFRFWIVGVKLLSITQAKIAIIYLFPFAVYFLLASRALHIGMSNLDDRPWTEYAANIAMLAGGFLIFLIVQYSTLFMTGTLITPNEPLNTIIMHQFVPLMLIIAVIGTFTYQRTGSYLPGAFINTLFVTWYIVASQAIQYPNIVG